VYLVVISREQIVYFMYVYRQRASNFIVFFLVSLKRYCIYIFEVLDCILIVAINIFVNIEAYFLLLFLNVKSTQLKL